MAAEKEKRPVPDTTSPYLTVDEVSYVLRCSPTTVRKMLQEGVMPHYQFTGRYKMIHRDDLDKFMLSAKR